MTSAPPRTGGPIGDQEDAETDSEATTSKPYSPPCVVMLYRRGSSSWASAAKNFVRPYCLETDEDCVQSLLCSPGTESSLESQTDMESTVQQSDDAALPSTSQDPDTSSVILRRTVTSQPLISSLSGRGARGARMLSRRGIFPRGGRGGMGRGGFA